MGYQCAENIKLNRATIAGIKSAPNVGFDERVVLDPTLFALEQLSRQGK